MADLHLERTRRSVSQLREYERNPRTISRERLENLKASLRHDPGFLEARPLIVNSYAGREGVVIAGNMRLRAARALGWDEVPVIVVAVPPEVEARWNLVDNNGWGEYLDAELAALLAELGRQGLDLELLGFRQDELERLLARAAGVPASDDAFDPTPPAVPESRSGDLYLLGPHRLICGDSRNEAIWKTLVSSETTEIVADLMWTDPPYGVDLAGVALPSRGKKARRAIAGDLEPQVRPLLRTVFARVDCHLRPGAPFYVAGPGGRLGATFVEEITAATWHLAQTLVWVKNSFVPGRSDYHHQHESIYYGWKTGAPHVWLGATDQATVIDDEPALTACSKAELVTLVKELRNLRTTDVIREDKTAHNDVHPTIKPVRLIQRMLANSSRRDDLVIDPFAGSGSTLIAAETLGRRAALIELDPGYCDVICRRWLALDPANAALRVRDGRTEAVGTDVQSAPPTA